MVRVTLLLTAAAVALIDIGEVSAQTMRQSAMRSPTTWGASAANPGSMNSYGGHAVAGSGPQLLGIEPVSPVSRGRATPTQPGSTGWATPTQPDYSGRAVQVQYPLDNRAYSGPDPETPQGYPMYAPGVNGIPQGYGPTIGSVTPQEVPWVDCAETIWESSWVLGGGGNDALGIFTNELRAKIDFPRAPMLSVSPRAAWHLLDGPVITDLPSQLYDASLETVVSLPLGDAWFVQGAISPSIFTDGHNTSGDAFRLPGRLLFFWKHSDQLTLAGGVVYLDREDVGILPTAGVIWKPTEDVRMELIIPRPRIAWRYDHAPHHERWVYVVGEFGGGSWAIDRASGASDVATLQDYRCLLGWEQTQPQGAGLRLEGGLVFNRSLEYVSHVGDRDLPTTALVRVALSY